MTAVDWQSVASDLEAQVALANGPDKTIGQGILNDLQNRGAQYSAEYTPEADAAKVKGDAAYALAFAKWRGEISGIAGDMDRVAMRAEAVQVAANGVAGRPDPTQQGNRTLAPEVPTPFDDPAVYVRTVIDRIRFAATLPALSDSWKGIVRRYLEQVPKLQSKRQPVPVYGRAYAGVRYVRGWPRGSIKQLEDGLKSTIAEAQAWMELQ